MDKKTKNSKPAFTGLTWHREEKFSFFVSKDWQKTEWPDKRQGIIFVPSSDDVHTLFAVEVQDLGTTVTADDLPYLSMGFANGIKQLPQHKIELKKESVVHKLIQLEAKYTFLEDEEIRKRWVRVLYHKTYQITFIAQGKSVESFDYWLPMFFESMMTLNVHDTKPTEPPI